MSLERQTVNSGLASDQGQGGPFLRWIDRLVGWIDFTGAVIVTTTLTAMFLGLFVNVVLRYALGDGITWAYEIPSILFPWMVAGGIVIWEGLEAAVISGSTNRVGKEPRSRRTGGTRDRWPSLSARGARRA